MTDYTKLIERMRTDSAFDFTTLGNEAADAIEALRAAQDRQSMQLAHDAVTIEGLNDRVMALIAEHERLSAGWQKANQEALQAKLTVQEQAKDIVLLCDDLKYIAGIARRAGMPVDDDNLKVRAAILGAVQILEAERDQLQAENERLKALSVTNILLAVVPGDGSGFEVYAKSVEDVVHKLSKIGEELENWQLGITIHPSAKERIDALQAKLDAMGKGEVVQGDPVPLYRAAINCPHEIEHEQVILKYDPKQPGQNALNQLGRRLVAAVAAPKALAPLTQTEVVEAFCNTRHNTQYVSVFDAGVRFAEKHHGIGGTP